MAGNGRLSDAGPAPRSAPKGVDNNLWSKQQAAEKAVADVETSMKYITMFKVELENTFSMIKITSYYHSSNNWYFSTNAALPTSTYNNYHYFSNVSIKGGRSADITANGSSGGIYNYYFYEPGTPDAAAQSGTAKSRIYSMKSSTNARWFQGNTRELWYQYVLKKTSYKVTSNDFDWYCNVQGWSAPIDANKNRDDIEVYTDVVKYLNDAKKELATRKQALQVAMQDVTTAAIANGASDPNLGKNTSLDLGSTGVGDDTAPVVYNLPGVKEVYFPSVKKASEEGLFITDGDTPRIVWDATQLWTRLGGVNSTSISAKTKSAHKGMIQSYIVPGNLDSKASWWSPAKAMQDVSTRNINYRRYGFQFLYNPSTVEMHYEGAPMVDIGLETSGLDKVPLIGSSVTSSTVTFQLLLNRMQDMKYVDAIKKDINFAKKVYPHFSNHPDTPNAGNINSKDASPASFEVQRIGQLGTMYDVEYLLRTLLGYQLQSPLRGNMWTSDIGYLGAYPVELHLGSSMRYLGTISSFDLNHTIFTKDMIPVFTNMTITFNRLPDFNKPFKEVKAISLSDSAAATNTSTTTGSNVSSSSSSGTSLGGNMSTTGNR